MYVSQHATHMYVLVYAVACEHVHAAVGVGREAMAIEVNRVCSETQNVFLV